MKDVGRGAGAIAGAGMPTLGPALAWVLALGGCGAPGTVTEPEDDDASTTVVAGSSGEADGSGSIGEPGPPVPLVTAEAWELDAADDDPFADHRPQWVQCEIGFGVETGVFEVDTELCTYGAFVQPSRAAIHAGDTLELVLLHDALYAEEQATAHVGLALGEEIAWETDVPIPSEAGQLRPTWTAPADVQVNTPIRFHVHNHGTNNYRLVALTVAGS